MSKIVQLKDSITNENIYPVVAKSILDYEEIAGTSNIAPLGISHGGIGSTTPENACGNLGIADYIVERGINSDWYYEKWNSGWCEAWCTWEFGALKLDTLSAGTYYNSTSTGRIVTVPMKEIVNAIGKETSPMTSGVWLYSYTFSGSKITAQFRSHEKVQVGNCSVRWYVVGYWK